MHLGKFLALTLTLSLTLTLTQTKVSTLRLGKFRSEVGLDGGYVATNPNPSPNPHPNDGGYIAGSLTL